MNKMRDFFLITRLRNLAQKKGYLTERWGNTADRHFLVDLESEGTKIMKTDDIEKVLKLLKDHGYDHGDAHWGNIMQTTD